ncbi:MAG: RnfABCDGE type electron transport complex subunit D [Oscillospiraceae bacterium]|nr:RnfABCDGE type electron transport complex subunit D [Oscillospiraceae bacterium]
MNKLIVENSPHIRSKHTTDKIMARVLIALSPALIMSVYLFGLRAFALSVICVLSCMVFEILYRRFIKKDKEIDLSPAVTGLLLAFCLPVTFPFYMAVIGCFIAIIIVKQFFGGLGQNFANPAVTARIVLFISFTSESTYYVNAFHHKEAVTDITTGATPLISGATPLALEAGEEIPDLIQLLLGRHSGMLGETCALALIIGFVYMVMTRVIRPVIPLAYVGTVALGAFLAGENVLLHVLGGGLILGAVFMATDYATTPVSIQGKFVFGVGCGLITLVIRFYSDMPEGVSFAILIMNILTFYIDRFTTPRAFGYKKPAPKEVKQNGKS